MKTLNTKIAWGLFILLALLEIGLTFYLAGWRETFWSAIETRQLDTFYEYLGYFCVVALTLCFSTSYAQYILQRLALLKRTKLFRVVLKKKWGDIEGGRQRVQQDCLDVPQLQYRLYTGLLKTFVLMIVYATIVCRLGVNYLFFPAVYAILSTVVCFYLAKPLINLNYNNQVAEAKLRETLTKRDYGKAYRNNVKLFQAIKYLGYCQVFFGQMTVVIPYIFLAPLYFAGSINLGMLIMVASAMNSFIDCLSYFMNSFTDINKYLSCSKRLKELGT